LNIFIYFFHGKGDIIGVKIDVLLLASHDGFVGCDVMTSLLCIIGGNVDDGFVRCDVMTSLLCIIDGNISDTMLLG